MRELSRVLVLRGLAALSFGLAAVLRPEMALPLLVTGFGIYLVSESTIVFYSAARCARREKRWHELALYGTLSLAGGVTALGWPGMPGGALLYLVSAWALAGGITNLLVAIRLRRELVGEWGLALSGVTSIALGLFAVTRPALAVWIGAYATMLGVVLLLAGRGLHARQHRKALSYALAHQMGRTRTL